LSEKAMEVVICDREHWTHEEYENQPDWLLDGIVALMNAQAERK